MRMNSIKLGDGLARKQETLEGSMESVNNVKVGFFIQAVHFTHTVSNVSQLEKRWKGHQFKQLLNSTYVATWKGMLCLNVSVNNDCTLFLTKTIARCWIMLVSFFLSSERSILEQLLLGCGGSDL